MLFLMCLSFSGCYQRNVCVKGQVVGTFQMMVNRFPSQSELK